MFCQYASFPVRQNLVENVIATFLSCGGFFRHQSREAVVHEGEGLLLTTAASVSPWR